MVRVADRILFIIMPGCRAATDFVRRSLSIGLIAFALLSGAHSEGQSTFGTILGIAQDPQGLGVPGAQVSIRSVGENFQRTVTTDGTGTFAVRNLQPGLYALTAYKSGFQDAVLAEARLEPQQVLRVTLKFSLPQENAAVEVSIAADEINTENGTISDVKSTNLITNMPLNFRATSTSPLASVALSPLVEQDSQGNIAIDGAMPAQVGFSVDGISTSNVRQNGPLEDAYPSSEAISEVQVTSFNNNAEFAQVGDVTFTSKSGTNQFHGGLFEYFENDVLDADVYNFQVKAPKRFNTFGGSFGGPLTMPKLYQGKDKTFFFLDYEGNRQRTATPEQYLVPTLAERNGDLSQLVSSPLIDPTTRRAFVNNTIPAVKINPTATPLLEYYPLPNVTAAGTSYNYETLDSTPSRTNGWDIRVDRVFTSKQQVYAL